MTDRPDKARHPAVESLLVAAGLVAAVLAWLLPWLVIDHFREVLAAFGAHLPWLTRWVFAGYPWLACLPLLVLACWWWWPRRRHRAVAACAVGVGGFVILMPLIALALWLPAFKLGAVVG